MLVLISPAKKLDTLAPAPVPDHTVPELIAEAGQLIDILKRLGPAELQRLMKLSPKLAEVALARHRQLTTRLGPDNAKPAVFAFKGDTYVGLDAASLTPADLGVAQGGLRILSGLYGLLRPLDLIQAYRLEMGARLANPRGPTLYDFWREPVTQAVNAALERAGGGPVVNLASVEYFSVLQQEALAAPVITPVFKEGRDGSYRVLGLFAKRARGMMARFIIRNRIDRADDLLEFADAGYRYNPAASEPGRPVFLRQQPRKSAA